MAALAGFRVALFLGVSGCLIDIGRGPDVGDCADLPEGTYTYGEIGIGTCLAGPTDVQFIEADGTTWLAVTNADPYRTFSSGSVLWIDFDSIDLNLPHNRMSTLAAHAVATDPFVGSMGYLPDRELMMVTSRYSPDAIASVAADKVLVFDAADPAAMVPWEIGASIEVEDDPQPLVIDPVEGVAYVGNLTDHSISVLETSATPILPRDLAPGASVHDARFFDSEEGLPGPFDGSAAEFDGATIFDASLVPSEAWTMTWIDSTWRLWAPEANGLARYETGGLALNRLFAGLEVEPEQAGATEVSQAFLAQAEGALYLYYSDEGSLYYGGRAATDSGWSWSSTPVLAGGSGDWDDWIGGASVVTLSSGIGMFYEGRASVDAPPSIGFALSIDDGSTYTREATPVLEAPEGYLGVGAPFVRNDPLSNTFRMWMSLWDGDRWTIGTSESRDEGATWSEVEEVLALDDGHVAAPVVSWANGRYVLWATAGEAGDWSHISAWSWDGREWFDVETALSSDVAANEQHPPRLAVQTDVTGAWRVESGNGGWAGAHAISGLTYVGPGFTFRVSNGFEVSGTVVGSNAANGIEPGSYAEIDGVPTLFVTTWDRDLIPHVAALQQVDGAWTLAADDLIPEGEGGNNAGVRSPVVTEIDGEWVMYYSAIDADEQIRIRRAVSVDGLSFVADDGEVVPTAGWDAMEQRPQSVELIASGEVRLWFAGTNGSQYRIGSAIGDGTTFSPEAGLDGAWQFDVGAPSSFDAEGVRDPMVLSTDTGAEMWYSGFDGTSWRIGHATQSGTGRWVRDENATTELSEPALSEIPLSFASGGVSSPVVVADGNGEYTAWYAGSDDDAVFPEFRIGRAVGRNDALYPAQRFPTAEDRIVFESDAGTSASDVIQLRQTIDGIQVSGEGMSSLVLDSERGFLYVTSKLSNTVVVLDIRNDTEPGFVDRNYLEVEALIVVSGVVGPRGFRDAQQIPGTNLLYLTSWDPDALVVVDLSELVDDDEKQGYLLHTQAILPLAYGTEDEGAESYSGLGGVDQISGGDMALSSDNRMLFVPHYQDNSLSVFDLSLDDYGREVRRITDIGEHPHLVRLSPDGRYAVVANYTGQVTDNFAESNLAIVDADPNSPAWMQVLTWLENR